MKQTKIIKMNSARHMVITPRARLSFPNLFKPRSFQDNPEGKKDFSCDLIFGSDKDFQVDYAGTKKQTPSMKKVVFNAKKDQWGPDKDNWPKFAHKTFKDGNERRNKEGKILDGYGGKAFITARCGEKFPPKIVGLDGLPLDERSVYGGCFVIAQLIARPYDYGGNRGVRFLLLQLQKVQEGPRFGGIEDDVFDVTEVNEEDIDAEEETDEDF